MGLFDSIFNSILNEAKSQEGFGKSGNTFANSLINEANASNDFSDKSEESESKEQSLGSSWDTALENELAYGQDSTGLPLLKTPSQDLYGHGLMERANLAESKLQEQNSFANPFGDFGSPIKKNKNTKDIDTFSIADMDPSVYNTEALPMEFSKPNAELQKITNTLRYYNDYINDHDGVLPAEYQEDYNNLVTRERELRNKISTSTKQQEDYLNSPRFLGGVGNNPSAAYAFSSASSGSNGSSSGSNNNSSTPYISAEERYPTNDNAQNYYNYLVNNYGEDAFNSLAIAPETLFQAYQEMMNGDWDSLYSFRKGASADEKNAYMELLANIYPELYQDYFDEQGNFINPWTDEPEYIDFSTIEQNPEWMFLASGLDSAKALAADMQAAGIYTHDVNGKKIPVDDLAIQLLVDAATANMRNNQAGFDAQTYRDVIQMLNPGVTDNLSVGKYEPGGTYSANYNTSFGNNDIDWDAILSAPTYNDRINAIEGIYEGRENFTQNDLQDWIALTALASDIAADRQYRQYGQNKEQ